MSTTIKVPGLSETCTPTGTIEARSNAGFLHTVLGNSTQVHYNSRTNLFVATHQEPHWSDATRTIDHGAFTNQATSLGVQAVHQCFALHQPLSLRPETLWYMISHEVAEYVRQNASDYAYLFTDTPDAKQDIVIRDDSLLRHGPSDWMYTIGLFRGALEKKVSDKTIDLFLPQFTTADQADETVLLLSLMDAASPFYNYVVFTDCGIPEVRLEGDAIDWRLLYAQTEQMALTFNGLHQYFEHLLPVLQTLAETAAGGPVDEEFWTSIYKQLNGSGGEQVSGWINAFFAYNNTDDGMQLKHQFGWGEYNAVSVSYFPSHVSTVPFKWVYYGEEIGMTFAAGITGVDYSDEHFLAPRLGFAVIEN
jgi:hypothetical protein